MDIKDLIKKAIELKQRAYAPYSNFHVACVVMTKSGKIFDGVNVENAAYSPSLCAERNALSTAITQGERDFLYIVITGDSDYTYPCGVCRQFIREFADFDTKIVVAKDCENYKTYTIEDLLPESFSKKDLE
ncbi:cytidine deaminase [Anaerococcus lactolyticus]|uniref:Cytidine deaminase n=1 Tax=Anaerococcus lactolyticus S7-1-13 TaxID=1284686 RepID=A0A095Z7E7_9FIRM|nr:cytidine deaminase [Anaerococcus lactolyticus]KGF04369.1 cytidine deaminase [Anaerococcus lactolyticus S7-1-13]